MTGSGLFHDKRGFTLLEVIVTMIVAAVLGSILVSFMGSSLTGSAVPLVRVQNASTINQVFENITADYNKLNSDDITNSTSVALSTLYTNIDSGNVSTSTPYYGAYTVVYKGYITFSGGSEVPDTSGQNKVFKVTLRQGDQTLTTLFTK